MRVSVGKRLRRAAGSVAVRFCLIAALVAAGAAQVRAADPNALWHIVHDLCAANMRANSDPTPCLAVESGGWAVIKDIHGATQLLLIPTDRITGIESARLLAPGSPNYFAAAWAAQGLFERRAGRPIPREALSLAVNSRYGRSQEQLHIHIDCLRPDVMRTLRAQQRWIGRRWAPLPATLRGHRYRAMRLDGADLGARDPIKLLATEPAARADMGRETLVVAGARFADGRDGFILLSDRAIPGRDQGSGEELQDHGCAVLGPRPPAP